MEIVPIMKNRSLIFAVSIGLVGLLTASVASAPAAQTPFYEGKTLRVLIASGPGGGTDTAGRLVARYLPKYLPGNPKIIIQNMGGGGGTIANNYFASEVKPDGLTIMQDSSSSVASFVRGGAYRAQCLGEVRCLANDRRACAHHRRSRTGHDPHHPA